MNKLTLVLIITCLASVSCTYKPGKQVREINADNHFALHVPADYIATGDMHDYAQLQLHDREQSTFIIGIREEKSELKAQHLKLKLDDYAHFAAENVAMGLDEVNSEIELKTKVNGHSAVYVEFEGTRQVGAEAIDLVYTLSVIEGTDAWYQLVSWTDLENAEQMRQEMNLIACSFKELAPIKNFEDIESLEGGAQAGE